MALVAVLTCVSSLPAGAVVGGTDDLSNQFASVGKLDFRDGNEWLFNCTGTLVAPRIVLTAAHCVDFVAAPGDVRMSFDPYPNTQTVYHVAERIEVHPDWTNRDTTHERGNSVGGYNAPGAEDVALVFLATAPANVPISRVAPGGFLKPGFGELPFTVVGYGTDAFLRGNNISHSRVRIIDEVRSYRSVSVITEQGLYNDRFLKITQSTCFGDSGGPIFLGNMIVGIDAWAYSYRCSGPNLEYRLDSAVAHRFLDVFLPPQ